MTEEQSKIWREGYEAGIRFVMNKNEDAIKIGGTILDVMYKRFATHEETD